MVADLAGHRARVAGDRGRGARPAHRPRRAGLSPVARAAARPADLSSARSTRAAAPVPAGRDPAPAPSGVPPRDVLDALAVADAGDHRGQRRATTCAHSCAARCAAGATGRPMRQLPLGVRLRDRAVFDSFLAGDNAAGAGARCSALAAAGRRGATWLARRRPAAASRTCCRPLCARPVPGMPPTCRCAQLLRLWPGRAGRLAAARAGVPRRPRQRSPAMATGSARCSACTASARSAAPAWWCAAAPLPHVAAAFALPDLGSRWRRCRIRAARRWTRSQQRAALQLRAAQRGLELPDETARYLQRRFARDMASCTGCSIRWTRRRCEAQRRLTVPFIRDVLDATSLERCRASVRDARVPARVPAVISSAVSSARGRCRTCEAP